jgi:hypothetical protein
MTHGRKVKNKLMFVKLKASTKALIFCHKYRHLMQGQPSVIWEEHIAKQNNHHVVRRTGFFYGDRKALIQWKRKMT